MFGDQIAHPAGHLDNFKDAAAPAIAGATASITTMRFINGIADFKAECGKTRVIDKVIGSELPRSNRYWLRQDGLARRPLSALLAPSPATIPPISAPEPLLNNRLLVSGLMLDVSREHPGDRHVFARNEGEVVCASLEAWR